jgi:hypothetical protein
MRQSIDMNTASVAASQEQITRTVDQLAAHQEQITREITELRTVEQYVLDKISTPALTPMPKAVLRPSHAPISVTPARNP